MDDTDWIREMDESKSQTLIWFSGSRPSGSRVASQEVLTHWVSVVLLSRPGLSGGSGSCRGYAADSRVWSWFLGLKASPPGGLVQRIQPEQVLIRSRGGSGGSAGGSVLEAPQSGVWKTEPADGSCRLPLPSVKHLD